MTRTNRRQFLKNTATGLGLALAGDSVADATPTSPSSYEPTVDLPPGHLDAVARRRRIFVNYDALAQLFDYKPAGDQPDLDHIKDHLLGLLDVYGDNHIDTVGWCWSEGNEAPYPSKVLPTLLDHPIFKHVPEEIDLVKLCCDETRKRGLSRSCLLYTSPSPRDRG